MKRASRQAHFEKLRKQYAFFVFQKYSIRIENKSLFLKFNFNLGNQFYFEPEIHIPARPFYQWERLPKPVLEQFVFHIGMVELISYWKAACPPQVIIKPFAMDNYQVDWWKKLYYNGLGEFFYLNGINTSLEDFMQLQGESDQSVLPTNVELFERGIVPVGGGKDSVVSLELIKKQGMEHIPFIVNPRKASTNCVAAAGFSTDETAVVKRTIDPLLLKLNEDGFLNGHTPFSALLAFVSALVAVAAASKYIILSNESSASEATVEGTNINHQYSKSIDFERDFREYCNKYLHPHLNYFSLLRPLNELQIGRLFSKFETYFPHFRSCNVGSKTNMWCCNCSKCLFTWLMLAPFVNSSVLQNIFGENLLQKTDLAPILRQLTGEAETKPFECVGTTEEVSIAIDWLTVTNKDEIAPLLKMMARHKLNEALVHSELENILQQLDSQNFVPPGFVQIIKEALYD